MFDDIDQSPIDFDDLDLPDPEDDDDFDEDVSEDPTVVAATDELLAAVAAKIDAVNSVGQIELEDEDAPDSSPEGSEPTLAHQPVPPPTVPAGPVTAAAPPAAAPQSSGIGGLILASLLFMGLIAGAMALAMNVL